MQVNKVINNPALHYRLDPGEPGLLRSAKASESALQVTAQERRNLVRLSSEAFREGRIVIGAHIKYQSGIAGSFFSVRAGKTTVVSREPQVQAMKQIKEKLEPPSNQELAAKNPLLTQPHKPAPQKQADSASPQLKKLPEQAQKMQAEQAREEQLQALRLAAQNLQQKIQKLELNPSKNKFLFQPTSSAQETREAEQELNRIRAKIAALQAEKTSQQLPRQNSPVLNSLSAANNNAFKVIQSAYGATNKPANIGSNLDLQV